jgi:hypothetical protein
MKTAIEAEIERVFERECSYQDAMCKAATAALTVALEEAARVCDPKGDCSEMDKYGEHYAAAIRALVKEDK